jgi:hypothetical protein
VHQQDFQQPSVMIIEILSSFSTAIRRNMSAVQMCHGWLVGEIERDVRLSGPQRVAVYELVTALAQSR